MVWSQIALILGLLQLQCQCLEKEKWSWWSSFDSTEQCSNSGCEEQATVESKGVPLVMPRNAYLEQGTGCWRIPPQGRGELYLHPDGANVLLSSNCSGGSVLISWNGHARCGKSLLASECSTSDISVTRNFSDHFELGHHMDSCSKGVFISSHPVPHPHLPDVCVFQLDVEGLNAFRADESSMESDAELAIFTYLTSSVWAFISRGNFDSHSLNLLAIVTRLAENMNIGENNLPVTPELHWILQGVHLKPELDGKPVSVQEYFNSTLASFDDTMRMRGKEKESAKQRNEIRESLMRSFRGLRVTALSPLTGDEETLRRLPHVPRNDPKVNRDFVTQVDNLKHDLVTLSTPLQLQRRDKLITAHGQSLVDFMNVMLEFINVQKPIPVFDAVNDVISKQIDKAKLHTVSAWKSCMDFRLKEDKKQELERRTEALINMTHAGQVGMSYWPDFLGRNVSTFIGEADLPHEQHTIYVVHQGCYRIALAEATSALNEESHDVQDRLVAPVELELGVGVHESNTNTSISRFQQDNALVAENFNKNLLELLWESHLTHLRGSFRGTLEEDFVDMLRVTEMAYKDLSGGPSATQVFFEHKHKFMVQAESFFAFGKTLRDMERKHDQDISRVREQMEEYQNTLTRLQNEYDTLNAEAGRLRQERDRQQEQHAQTIKEMQGKLAAITAQSQQLNESRWQLQEHLAAREREYEQQIQVLQKQYTEQEARLANQGEELTQKLDQKSKELQDFSTRFEREAEKNSALRTELDRLNRQSCGTRNVTACTGINYGGTCRDLGVSWWSHCSLIRRDLPDDSIRSARIPPGCHFEVYRDRGYVGPMETHVQDVPNIPLRGISSARVY